MPRRKATSTEKREAPKRARLADAARSLFASRPFHEVRLEDVAEEADVSKGTVYTYFESKQELLLTLIQEDLQALAARLEQRLAAATGSSEPLFHEIIAEVLAFCHAHPTLIPLLRTSQGEIKERCASEGARLFLVFETVIRRGISRGEWRDPHPAWTARLIAGAMSEIIDSPSPRPEPRRMARHLVHVFVRGLGSRP